MEGTLLVGALSFGSLRCEISDARYLAGVPSHKELAKDDFGEIIAPF